MGRGDPWGTGTENKSRFQLYNRFVDAIATRQFAEVHSGQVVMRAYSNLGMTSYR
jgi:hypothetical protein